MATVRSKEKAHLLSLPLGERHDGKPQATYCVMTTERERVIVFVAGLSDSR